MPALGATSVRDASEGLQFVLHDVCLHAAEVAAPTHEPGVGEHVPEAARGVSLAGPVMSGRERLPMRAGSLEARAVPLREREDAGACPRWQSRRLLSDSAERIDASSHAPAARSAGAERPVPRARADRKTRCIGRRTSMGRASLRSPARITPHARSATARCRVSKVARAVASRIESRAPAHRAKWGNITRACISLNGERAGRIHLRATGLHRARRNGSLGRKSMSADAASEAARARPARHNRAMSSTGQERQTDQGSVIDGTEQPERIGQCHRQDRAAR